MVAAALLLSACQVDRLTGDWLQQPTTEPAAAAAAGPSLLAAPAHSVSGWVPYWGTESSRAAIAAYPGTVGDVSPLFYGANDDGTLRLLGPQAQLNATVQAARTAGLPLIVGIFDSTAPGVMSGILADPAGRTAHVQQIVSLAVNNGYDGIDLDYEVFAFNQRAQWGEIKPNWIAFVSELSAALHASGTLLSVTVPPVYRLAGGLLAGYTVYAQQEIAPVVDRLRLMVYDWSISSPGPISPYAWMNSVIEYSSSVVADRSKLQLGVPVYGRHWVTKRNANETCPDSAVRRESVLMKNLAPLAAGRNVTRDPASGEITFTWTETVSGPRTKPLTPPVIPPATVTIRDIPSGAAGTPPTPAVRLSTPSALVTCTVVHTVFVPDEVTVQGRVEAAQAAGWRGIILWAFGYESPNLFPLLAG